MSAERTHRIVICAKSSWHPALRREHALATAAGAAGLEIQFVEQPTDVRQVRADPRWLLRTPAYDEGADRPVPGVEVVPRRTIVPGHRAQLAHAIDAFGLKRELAHRVRSRGPVDAVVVNTPWNWAGTAGLPAGTRRVFDLTDDWRTMMPKRRERIERWYRRIDDEADDIIVVSPALQERFRRRVTVVPNAAASELLVTCPTEAPGGRRLLYVGTLSERFDAALIAGVMRQLPNWTLDLYGPELYGVSATPGLDRLVTESDGRVRRHGVVSRSDLAAVIDGADVAIVPNVPAISAGQDSMKLYDYAARGRPIVASGLPTTADVPPSFARADDAVSFATAVEELSGQGASANRAWSERHTWEARSSAWLSTVLGSGPAVATTPTGGASCTS